MKKKCNLLFTTNQTNFNYFKNNQITSKKTPVKRILLKSLYFLSKNCDDFM